MLEIFYKKGLYCLVKKFHLGPIYWYKCIDAFGTYDRAEQKKFELEKLIEEDKISV